MSAKSSGRLSIPQWGVVSRVVTAFDITTNEYDKETSRARTDLTGAVVHFTVKDKDGTVVIQKASTDVAEIEILNQLVAATKGQARVYFVEADTAPLTAGEEYWFDCWAASATNEEPVVDRGRFIVCESVTHISAGPAPSLPTFPASQTPQFRNWQYTTTTAADNFAITIPGGGMVDSSYSINAFIVDLGQPTDPVSIAYSLAADQTATTFTLRTAGAVAIGTVFSLWARDSA